MSIKDLTHTTHHTRQLKAVRNDVYLAALLALSDRAVVDRRGVGQIAARRDRVQLRIVGPTRGPAFLLRQQHVIREDVRGAIALRLNELAAPLLAIPIGEQRPKVAPDRVENVRTIRADDDPIGEAAHQFGDD